MSSRYVDERQRVVAGGRRYRVVGEQALGINPPRGRPPKDAERAEAAKHAPYGVESAKSEHAIWVHTSGHMRGPGIEQPSKRTPTPAELYALEHGTAKPKPKPARKPRRARKVLAVRQCEACGGEFLPNSWKRVFCFACVPSGAPSAKMEAARRARRQRLAARTS